MKGPTPEKEELVQMLTGIYDQLEALEQVLEVSFSNHRYEIQKEEQKKMTAVEEKMSALEENLTKRLPSLLQEEPSQKHSQGSKSLKLEMGF